MLELLAGESLEKTVRVGCKAYLQGLAWTFAYYVMGNIPVLLPGASAALLGLAIQQLRFKAQKAVVST